MCHSDRVVLVGATEEDITASAEKIFSRGWSRMKCYFMIGLPTETDEDVAGITQTAGRVKRMVYPAGFRWSGAETSGMRARLRTRRPPR